MVDADFLLNRWIIPIVLTSLFLIFLCNKNKIIELARKSKRKKSYYLFLIDSFKVELGDWKKTVLLPGALAIAINLTIMLALSQNPANYSLPLWYFVITAMFANPISEEFVTRGFILGFFPYFAQFYKIGKSKRYLFYFIGLLFTSVVFVQGHENIILYQYTTRFVSSMLFGILYLANSRNLLPSIVAHSTGNAFLIILGKSGVVLF